jgi:hypothetical protein
MTSTPNKGEAYQSEADQDIVSAADAFYKQFVPEDAKKPSDDKSQNTTPQDDEPKKKPSDESPEDEDEGKSDETTEKDDDEKTSTYVEDEGSLVKLKVGDEEHEVPVKDLKRLWGQEAALTKRSQEVAEQRKSAEMELAKATTALNAMLKRAQDRAAPFEKIDFLMAAKHLSDEELTQLRESAKAAFDEKKFFETELNGFTQYVQTKQEEAHVQAAEKALEQINDPASPYHIEEWNDKLYDNLREFGVANGLPSQVMDQLTDAPVFKLLHQAMMFQRGSKKVVETKKQDKTPKKIIKTSHTPDPKHSQDDKLKKATIRLRKTGNPDDAAELFMAQWDAKTPITE